jgi:hypothetical protein
MRFSFGMNVDRSVKFSSNHVAPVARIKPRLREARFFSVPNELAKSAGVPFAIAPTRPGRYIAGLGMVVPDECLGISCALISSFAARDVHQHEQQAANKNKSPPHG